jgi:hypothetical protein
LDQVGYERLIAFRVRGKSLLRWEGLKIEGCSWGKNEDRRNCVQESNFKIDCCLALLGIILAPNKRVQTSSSGGEVHLNFEGVDVEMRHLDVMTIQTL